MKISINDKWNYFDKFSYDFIREKKDGEVVRLPHTFEVLKANYVKSEDYQKDALYTKSFKMDDGWVDKRIFLYVEGAAHHSYVYLNGTLLKEHKCGYTAYEVELTDHILKENLLAIRVDSRENAEIPPFGGTVDYLGYSGLYREVNLYIRNQSYIDDVYVHTEKSTLYADVCFETDKENITVEFELLDGENKINVLVKETEKNKYEIKPKEDIAMWDIESPKLYHLKVKAILENQLLDEYTVRFGFRDIVFNKEGFFLNGKKVKIRGLNRHQSYPYVGYAMPESGQYTDARILKKELSLNAVRTSHYPQSKHFINACDELGLLVFTEIPGWQHIGDEKWQEISINNVKDMVLQYRNHPSIIMWGVRINESKDLDEFYYNTNKAARDLDPYRPTGGVRCYDKSSFLEDVYTFNDFSFNGLNEGARGRKSVTGRDDIPYLITEYNGHMFPTKPFDSESHLLEHALRHARVVDSYSQRNDIAGGFGWCMSDYQTHVDFGGDDMVCYHGVCDMFRNLKPAGYFYQSQGDGLKVLEVMPSMNLGENPESRLGKLYAFTNMDYVELYVDDIYINRFYPKGDMYKALKHPPIEIDDIIGNKLDNENYGEGIKKDIKYLLKRYSDVGLSGFTIKDKIKAIKLMTFYGLKPMDFTRLYEKYIGNWGGERPKFKFIGYKEGEESISVTKGAYKECDLEVIVDKTHLIEKETYDVASVRLRMLNQFNQIMRYYQEPLLMETEGPIMILGPKIVSLKGGMGGTYIKTMGKGGKGRLKITYGNNIIKSMDFNITIGEVDRL